jgi:cytidylate kinase
VKKIPFEDARKKLAKRDVEEKEVFKKLYALSDSYNPKWVDLKVNTLDPAETLVKQILNYVL